jgi:hypothetical protein
VRWRRPPPRSASRGRRSVLAGVAAGRDRVAAGGSWPRSTSVALSMAISMRRPRADRPLEDRQGDGPTGPDLLDQSSAEHGATPLHQLTDRDPAAVDGGFDGGRADRMDVEPAGLRTTSVGGGARRCSVVRSAGSIAPDRWNRRSRRRSMGRTAAGLGQWRLRPEAGTGRTAARSEGRAAPTITGRHALVVMGPRRRGRRFGSTSVDGADPTSAGCPVATGTGWSRPVHHGPGRPRRF